MKIKTARKGAIISAVFLLLAICFCVPSIKGSIIQAAYAASGRVIHYFNDDVNADQIGNNNFNFGPDRKAQADQAVADGKATSVQEWVATNQGTGDFFESIKVDPALCAAVAVHMDESLVLPETILRDEQDIVVGQRADEAHLHFLKDQDYWDRAVALIADYLTSSEISIQGLDHYTSQMYQWHNHLEGNKPSVIVRDTQNEGGHVVVFDMGKPGIVKFRLECGYQPVDIPYWTPPVPPDEPTPTPTPEPKDPDAGPQQQADPEDPGYEDFGGGPNHDSDETITDEPQSPETYTPPAPPQPDPEPAPSQTPTERPTTSDGQPDASTGTDTGSATIDHDDGTTEQHGGETYEVVAGDGEDHGDLNQIQEEQHGPETVEPAVQDDGVNEGDLDPADIE